MVWVAFGLIIKGMLECVLLSPWHKNSLIRSDDRNDYGQQKVIILIKMIVMELSFNTKEASPDDITVIFLSHTQP